MSNLKERIGRKVGYNNKSWIRPGYQVKQSPPQQPRIRQQISTAAGYESDRSSHEEDSGHCDRPSHPGFRNSARSTSLLERMGISPGADSGDDDEDTEAIAKSLFERVGLVAGVETVHGTFSSARTPDNVHRSEKDQESVNALAGTLTTAQPLANDPGNVGTALANLPTNGNADKDDILPHQVNNVFQDHARDEERSKDKSISGPSNPGKAVNSTPPRNSHNPSNPLEQFGNGNFSDFFSNDIDMVNTHNSRNATPRHTSSVEARAVLDREVPEKVRELLVPLMLQNAASRTSAAHDTQTTPLDMDTLTDTVCSSFQGKVKELRKSMDSIENRPNVATEAHRGLVKHGSANDSPRQAENTQKEVASQPKASTSQITTHREESSHSNESSTYERGGRTLRYTPSPQRHHWSRSSVGDNQQLDSFRNDHRSSSPQYHTGIRRSPSGERRQRLPPNAHEYHSPEPELLREGRRSLSPSRQRRYRRPSSSHGRRSLSASRHSGRRWSPSGAYRHRFPPNAHEYHSPEPPSPRARSPHRPRSPGSASRPLFPDKFRRSPESRSRSPYESARHRRGTVPRGRGDYRGQRRREDYRTRRSASPRPRRPYAPYSSNRRRSRSPRHHSQSSHSPQMSDQVPASRYSPVRQPQAKRRLDGSSSSRSMSISDTSRNNQKDLSEAVTPTGLMAEPSLYAEQTSGETATAQDNLETLPCHHVPGLWFVKVALNDMGTLECSFDIDSETAIKWNFSRNGDAVKSDITDHTLSLQICCFPTNLVEETFRSLQHNATPEDIASAIFSLKTEWPLQGHLIIVVNPQNEENHTKKVFLPEKLGPGNSPISIKDFVQQGKNIVQFIQLSNMAGKVFALCAKKKDTKPDDVTYASKEDNIIRTPSGVVKVLPL